MSGRDPGSEATARDPASGPTARDPGSWPTARDPASGPQARDPGSWPQARDPGPETKLRLVSWNVHAVPGAPRIEKRLRAISRAVAARAPDLVLFQEVWRYADAEALDESLWLAGYDAVGLSESGRFVRSSGLLAFVRAVAGWRVSEERLHAFRAEAPDWKLWEGDGFGDKGVHGFTLSRAGVALEVLNTHLQAAYEPAGYADVRRAQLRELRELAEAVEATPVLVAGDLNTTPDEPGWQELRAFRDLTARLRESCGCGTSVRSDQQSLWIDHLLARVPDGWRVEADVSLLKSQRPDVPYSDHHGLDAVVRIAPPAGRASLAALATTRLAGATTRREFLAWLGALALRG